MKQSTNFSVVNLSQQDIPIVIEDIKTRYQWVPVGIIGPDDYFQNITDSYTTSTEYSSGDDRTTRTNFEITLGTLESIPLSCRVKSRIVFDIETGSLCFVAL
jgi:hypothetical protein